MLPFEFDCSPALAEVLLTGRTTQAGVAATLVRVASQGWCVIQEQDRGRYALRQRLPMTSNIVPSDESERILLRWLRHDGASPQAASVWRARWPEWVAGLQQQAIAQEVLTASAWQQLRRWRFVSPIVKRAIPAQRVERWHAHAERLTRYPVPTDPLPATRQEWDTVLAYAVALGQARAFLRHAREVCEYYERHFEGIVITFFTPRWYVPRHVEGEGRFAFLTEGLGGLLTRFQWDRLHVGEPVAVSNPSPFSDQPTGNELAKGVAA